jgi:hypothetical protein
MRDICGALGGRSDKRFLGTGTLGLVLDAARARVLHAQAWTEGGLMDWAAGAVKSWAPDRIALAEIVPPRDGLFSVPPSQRWSFASRNDILGAVFTWRNRGSRPITVHAVLEGALAGKAREDTGRFILGAVRPYSDLVPTPVHTLLGSNTRPKSVSFQAGRYELSFAMEIGPGSTTSLAVFVAIGVDQDRLVPALAALAAAEDPLAAVRDDWNRWFQSAVPSFECSDPFFERLYYYRWWSLATKMIHARVGHLLYPAPREGSVAYEGIVSYSSSCVSVDELRWMRDPAWAFSTVREFFASGNLNDGYLSNHIWAAGIDGDPSNRDSAGRDVPYHNYATAAFHGALRVHPGEGAAVLREIWPQLKSNLDSYARLFDADRDGLYETWPWSNSAGQEWQARYLYFDPITEIFRYERDRRAVPSPARAGEEMDLVAKIRESVVTDPGFRWPGSFEELCRHVEETRDHRLATVDQSTYALAGFRAGVRLAAMAGDPAAGAGYARAADLTQRQILSVMWDPRDAFFYDVRPFDHVPARVKAVTGFYVFWAGIAGREHLPMLEHLFDPAVFWTAYPLPSLPMDYPRYGELQRAGWTYWNYATWPRATCHVVDGLLGAAKSLDPSLAPGAAELFRRYTRMHFIGGNPALPCIAERYDPHTAEPFWPELDYNHSSWIDLLVCHAAGLVPQDTDTLVVDPVDMGFEHFALRGVRYRGHDVDIVYRRGTGLAIRVDSVERAAVDGLQRVVIDLEPPYDPALRRHP